MIHRHFQNPQPRTRGTHLHLQVPAVGFFLHPESLERVTANGAERTHVGVANAVKNSQKDACDPPGENLLEIHAPGFALPAGTRANHKILLSVGDGPNKSFHQFRTIAAVAIKKGDDPTFRGHSSNSGSAGATVTGRRLSYHLCAGRLRAFGRAIRAAIIDHNHFVGQTCR